MEFVGMCTLRSVAAAKESKRERDAARNIQEMNATRKEGGLRWTGRGAVHNLCCTMHGKPNVTGGFHEPRDFILSRQLLVLR